MSKRALLIASLVLGGLGTIGMIIGFITDPTQAAFSYLTAWVYAVSIALGALIFLMIAHATQGKWFIVFRRFGEMIVASLPILALAFIPIALELGRIYVWVHPPATLDHEALATIAHKAPYLNPTFFIVRTAIFFAFWIAIAGLLTRFAARSDRDLWVVGDDVRHWNGERWTQIDPGVVVELRGVCVVEDAPPWIVGSDDLIRTVRPT